jgi:hypothetical protein
LAPILTHEHVNLALLPEALTVRVDMLVGKDDRAYWVELAILTLRGTLLLLTLVTLLGMINRSRSSNRHISRLLAFFKDGILWNRIENLVFSIWLMLLNQRWLVEKAGIMS